MKYKILSTIVLLLSITTSYSAQANSAAIKSYDFDQNLQGWSMSGDRIIHAKQLGRNYTSGIQINSPAANTAPFTSVKVEGLIPEATYELRAWARTHDGSPAVTAAVKIEYYNSEAKNTSGKYAREDLEINSTWKPITLRLKADSDTSWASIYLRVYGKGSVIFDDVSFQLAAAPLALVVAPDHQLIPRDEQSLVYDIRLGQPWEQKVLPEFQVKAFRLNRMAEPDVASQITLPATAVEIDKSHYSLRVDASALSQEENYLLEFCYSKDGAELKANGAKYAFSVPADRKPQTLSDKGYIIRNGKPFFPIGMYHAVNRPRYNNGLGAENFDDLKQHEHDYRLLAANGFNAVQGNITHNLDLLKASLDIAQKYGIAVDVPLYLDHQIAGNLDISLQKIERFHHHPAILNWKIEDEPNLRPQRAHEIPVVYNALKKVDHVHPLELTFMAATDAVWAKFSDIVQVDQYPLPGRSIEAVHGSTTESAAFLEPWQNLSMVLQSGWTADLLTQPSVTQARSMVYMALIGGAKGIWWYSMYDPNWDLIKTPLWPHFKAINAETQALAEPVMLGEDITSVTGNNPKVLFRALKYAGKLYVIITNPLEEAQEIELKFPADLPISNGKSLDGRDVNLTQHQLALSMDAVDSRTWMFDIQ